MPASFLTALTDVCRRLKIPAFWVGGTVRDRLLGRESHDWDLVCPQAKRVATAVAKQMGATLVTLDEHYRIYRIVPREGMTIDFAELQGKTIQQDLARRDFTINAMALPLAADPAAKVIDPFGGEKDLRRKRVRALSRKAFVDDPLRLLRAYRMSAQFGFTLEAQTRRWIRAEQGRLETAEVARERVREEFLRLLNQRRAGPVVAAMDQDGVLTVIFPDLEAGRRVGVSYYGKGGVVKHHLQSLDNVEWLLDQLDAATPTLKFIPTSDIAEKMREYVASPLSGFRRAAFLKLGALLHDIGKPATAQVLRGRLRFFGHEEVGAQIVRKTLEKLRFSRQENYVLRQWVRHHMRPGSLANAAHVTDKAMARFFRDLGEEGVGMVLISLGDHYTYLARAKWGKGKDVVERTARRLLEAYYLQQATVFPPRIVDGHQLMKKLRLKPGPLVGKLLEAIRDAQTEGKVKTEKDALVVARDFLKLSSPRRRGSIGFPPSRE